MPHSFLYRNSALNIRGDSTCINSDAMRREESS
nr:MAG TPA: hypothetical protein [Caudoviricetes sp.]DAY84764.1 MAG TPA: hypothetical protein [Caudoviricetes sp.]